MAIGDAAAAAGLKTYTAAQDRRLGYENDNQRGDELAAAMARITTLEQRLNGLPVVLLRSSVSQATAATANEWSRMSWNIEEFDRGAMHELTEASRDYVTCPRAGLVAVSYAVKIRTFDAIIRARIMQNNVVVPGTVNDDRRGDPEAWPIARDSTLLRVAAGDVLHIQVSSSASGRPIDSALCRFTVNYETID
jgi:hypothetical protein